MCCTSCAVRGNLVLLPYRTNSPAASPPPGLGKPLPAITHYSSTRPFTKYEMTTLVASYLGLPHGHVVADKTDPNVAAEEAKRAGKPFTIRPGNTQLAVDETEALIGKDKVKESKTFEEWWQAWAAEHKKSKA